jgi:photosystem II stability/assembly factor-like uncharacterized protein
MKKFLLLSLLTLSLFITSKAQWQRTCGPGKDRIYCMEQIGSVLLYGGSYNHTFLKSYDDGMSWIPADIQGGSDVTSIAVKGNLILVANGSIYRSEDTAGSWEPSSNGIAYSVSDLTFNDTRFFAACNRGVYISDNNGLNWTFKYLYNNAEITTNCVSADGNNIIAGTEYAGIFISHDNGETWVHPTGNCPADVLDQIVLYDHKFYVLSGYSVYLSEDAGENWQEVITGMDSPHVNYLSQNNTSLFAATNNGIFHFLESQNQWIRLNPDFDMPVSFIYTNDGNIFCKISNKGLYKSIDNCISWIDINCDLAHSTVLSELIVEDRIYAGCQSNGIFSSEDFGNSWQIDNSGIPDNTAIKCFLQKDTVIYAGTYSKGIYSRTLNNKQWKSCNIGLTDLYITSMTSSGSKIYCGTSSRGVFKSDDNGISWHASNNGLSTLEVQCLFQKGTTLFAGTLGGGIFRSFDEGATWTMNDWSITDIFFTAITESDGYLYATSFNYGIYASTNNGDSWFKLSNDVELITINAIVAENKNIIIGSKEKGIMISHDRGNTWYTENEGLLYNNVNSLVKNGNVLVTGTSDGIYINETILDISDLTLGNSDRFELYPNPAPSGSQYLNLKTFNCSPEKVEICDIQGRVLCSVDGIDNNTTKLSINNLTAGVYLVKLYRNNEYELHKLIIY